MQPTHRAPAWRTALAGFAALAMLVPATVANAQDAGDPREGLGAGLDDAETASEGMDLVASLPKPPGFSNPDDPGDFSFVNSDLAFSGDLAVMGNYAGVLLYDISDPTDPTLRSAMACPGGQGDVSVSGDLLFVSVQQLGTEDCSELGEGDEPFLGVRVFDISDPTDPLQVAAVEACRGSHTHTLLESPADDDNVYIYVSGTNRVRTDTPTGLDCEVGPVDAEGNPSNDPDDFDSETDTSRFQIEIIEVPIDAPQDAAIVAEPRIFADADGNPFGLEEGGQQGEDGQQVATTDSCHDITVYPEFGLAAGACEGNGILFDITDPVAPVRLDVVSDPSFAYWHSATFNNDGTKVVFTDELGGGIGATCLEDVRDDFGANAIYDLVRDGDQVTMEFASHHKIPPVQTDTENCVAHNGSLLPVPGRDILVQAWYQGGISVMDFTDSSAPREIAFFDRGPIDADELVLGGYWSAYYHNGYVYGSEIARGFDVLELTPTDELSATELASASDVRQRQFNPQMQPMITAADRSACAGVDPVSFTDVTGGVHADAVGCVAGYGIALGFDDGTFRPASAIDRAQMASFLARELEVAGVTLPSSPPNAFTDDDDSVHADQIDQLAELGILFGRTETTYAPDDEVSRDQMASLLVRTVEEVLDDTLPAPRSPFTDVESGGPHTASIDAAHAAGIAFGTSPTTFEPREDVRRDQMATFVSRSLEVLFDDLVELTPRE